MEKCGGAGKERKAEKRLKAERSGAVDEVVNCTHAHLEVRAG